MPRRTEPWLGKCGELHYPGQKCKTCLAKANHAYHNTDKGKAAKLRAWEKYYAKPGNREKMLQRWSKVKGKNLTTKIKNLGKVLNAHVRWEREAREHFASFISCFDLTPEGFVIYDDKMPLLLELRQSAVRMARLYVKNDGVIFERK